MSKRTLVTLGFTLITIAFAKSGSEVHEKHYVGPFQHQILNDMFKALLTLVKMVVDLFRRNIQSEEGVKVAVKQVSVWRQNLSHNVMSSLVRCLRRSSHSCARCCGKAAV